MESNTTGAEMSIADKVNPEQLTVTNPAPDLVPDSNRDEASTNSIVNSSTESVLCSRNEMSLLETGLASAERKASPEPTPSILNDQSAVPQDKCLLSTTNNVPSKNRNSREDKYRKKDDKSVDHVLKALNSLNTTEEKLAAMCKKYADLFDEHRKQQLLHKQSDKKTSQLQKEKEVLQADHTKAILTRSRVENLCRELQRQNKAIKDESSLKIREEEEKRKEVSAKFQATMNEITTLMQQNNENNMKLRDDNIDMTAKLNSICEQYEARQQQVERISHQMQLEQQLADAKLKKVKMEMENNRTVLLEEKKQLLMELNEYQQRFKEFQETEINLRGQISMYNDKYDEFQKALARSNDVFGGFKGEMEKMSKKILKLEKETSAWKLRWERSHSALLEMAAEKQRSEQDLAVVMRQLATLQGLCRTLQTERSTMMAELRGRQAGGPEAIEKSASTDKCLKQCLDQTACHTDQSVNHMAKNDPVLVQYNQDLLASFKEAVLGQENSASDSVAAECPLPDVVGDSQPNTNYLCDRLDDISLKLNSLSKGETDILNVSSNVSANGIDPPVSDAATNGHPDAPLLQDASNTSLGFFTDESPSKNSGNGKKTKELSKKKKK